MDSLVSAGPKWLVLVMVTVMVSVTVTGLPNSAEANCRQIAPSEGVGMTITAL